VLFPVSRAARPVEQAERTPVAAGRGTILVVDDEETIRRLMKTALEHHGYEVLLAENGSEALAVFARQATRITAVVLDLVMPVMSGEEALPHLLTMKPAVPVIVSSGQDPAEAGRMLGESRIAGYLQKPYRADTLVRKVQEVLSYARPLPSTIKT